MTTPEIFKQETQLDPDYFLEIVLRFLGKWDTPEELSMGRGTSSFTYLLDSKGKAIGEIWAYPESFTIRRVEG